MIDINARLSSLQSILCLNGDMPPKRILSKKLPIIAADGASIELLRMGVEPTLIIGDFDSTPSNSLLSHIEKIRTPDQNYTDFEKSMAIIADRQLLPCLLCGVSGKELDHFLYNLHVISRLSQQLPLLFHSFSDDVMDQYGIISKQHLQAQLPQDSTISLLPFPSATISTQGLTWNVHAQQLTIEGQASVRNKVADNMVEIEVHEGTVIVMFSLNVGFFSC